MTIQHRAAEIPVTLGTARDSPSRLGQSLVRARIITAEILEEALVRATAERQRLGDALIAMGAATATDVLQALALQQELPFLSAEELPSTPPALRNLSPKYLRQYLACPVAVDGAVVTVATADPTNPLLLDELRQMLGLRVALCVAPPGAILVRIDSCHRAAPRFASPAPGPGRRCGRFPPSPSSAN